MESHGWTQVILLDGAFKLHFKPTSIGRYMLNLTYNNIDVYDRGIQIDVVRKGLSKQKPKKEPKNIDDLNIFELEFTKLKDQHGRYFELLFIALCFAFP